MDDGTIVRLETATDNIGIGSAVDQDAKLAVVNDVTTKKGFRVVGVASQADDFLLVEKSDGTDIFSVDSSGTIDLKPVSNSNAFLIDGGSVTSAGLLRLKSFDRTTAADEGVLRIDSNASSLTGNLVAQYIDVDTIPTANATDRTITGLAIEMTNGDQADATSHTTIGLDIFGQTLGATGIGPVDIGARIANATTDLSFTDTAVTLAIGDTGTLSITDGTNTLLSLADAGSTGNLTISGTITASPMTSGSILFAGASGLVSQNNANLFWDNTNGRLGIGTTEPAVSLAVAGDIRVGTSSTNGCVQQFAGTALVGTCASDIALKTNISEIRGVADDFTKLRFVHYEWNGLAAEKLHNLTGIKNTGLIAQELENVFPELVSMGDEGFKKVDFGTLQFYSYKAIQETNLKVEGLTLIDAPIIDATGHKTFVGRYFDRLIAWFGNAANGITKFFAKSVETEELCVKDPSGAKTCITKSQLDALLLGSSATSR